MHWCVCPIALLHAALLPCCMLAVANNICLCADVLACRSGRFLLLLWGTISLDFRGLSSRFVWPSVRLTVCVYVCCGCWGHMSTTSHMALHFVLMVCTVAVSLHSTGCLLGVGDTLTQTLGHSVMFHTAICKVFISQLRLCHWAQVMVKHKQIPCATPAVSLLLVCCCVESNVGHCVSSAAT